MQVLLLGAQPLCTGCHMRRRALSPFLSLGLRRYVAKSTAATAQPRSAQCLCCGLADACSQPAAQNWVQHCCGPCCAPVAPCAANLSVQQCPCATHLPVQQRPCAAHLPVQQRPCAGATPGLPAQQPTSVEGDLLGVAEAHERLQCALLPGGHLEVQLPAVAIAPLLQLPPAGGGPSVLAVTAHMKTRCRLRWNGCWFWTGTAGGVQCLATCNSLADLQGCLCPVPIW